jgi:type I restriction enzyme, S subunit
MSSVQHWKNIKLKYLADMRSGESITSDAIEPTGLYPVYGGGALRGYTSECTHEGKYVLIGRQGAHCGNVKTVQGEFWASEHAIVVTPSSIVDIEWLGYLLESMNLNQYSMSAAQPGLAVSMIKSLEVLLPPKNIQEKITKYINFKVSSLEELIEQKEKLIQLLEEKRQSMITEAVTKGLNLNVKMKDSGADWIGEIPEHWEIKKLKRCFKVINGKEITFELDIEDENGIDVFGSGGKFKKTNEYIYDGESVLFGRKGTIGKPLYVNREFWTVDTMYFTKFYKESYPKWFYYVLKAYPWHLIMTQTALPSIVGSDVENDYWCIPSYNEQKEITNYLDKINDNIGTLISDIGIQIKNLKDYRQSLIYEAVTGKIDVRDFELVSE